MPWTRCIRSHACTGMVPACTVRPHAPCGAPISSSNGLADWSPRRSIDLWQNASLPHNAARTVGAYARVHMCALARGGHASTRCSCLARRPSQTHRSTFIYNSACYGICQCSIGICRRGCAMQRSIRHPAPSVRRRNSVAVLSKYLIINLKDLPWKATPSNNLFFL